MKRSLTEAFVTIIDIPEFSHFLFVDYTREVYRLDKRYGNNKDSCAFTALILFRISGPGHHPDLQGKQPV